MEDNLQQDDVYIAHKIDKNIIIEQAQTKPIVTNSIAKFISAFLIDLIRLYAMVHIVFGASIFIDAIFGIESISLWADLLIFFGICFITYVLDSCTQESNKPVIVFIAIISLIVDILLFVSKPRLFQYYNTSWLIRSAIMFGICSMFTSWIPVIRNSTMSLASLITSATISFSLIFVTHYTTILSWLMSIILVVCICYLIYKLYTYNDVTDFIRSNYWLVVPLYIFAFALRLFEAYALT